MFADPQKNLNFLEIREDMIVADLGAGTGHYSVLASKMVPFGKVYAFEIQKDFVETIKNKIKSEKIHNLDCFLADIENFHGTKLADNLVDRAIISNVFYLAEDKEGIVKEAKRILKIGGKILVIDLLETSFLLSSSGHFFWSKEKIQELFLKNGFSLDREFDTGDHHYGLIFTKNGK